METPTHPLTQPRPPLTHDEPSLSTALWVLVGFLLFAVVIFSLVVNNPW